MMMNTSGEAIDIDIDAYHVSRFVFDSKKDTKLNVNPLEYFYEYFPILTNIFLQT